MDHVLIEYPSLTSLCSDDLDHFDPCRTTSSEYEHSASIVEEPESLRRLLERGRTKVARLLEKSMIGGKKRKLNYEPRVHYQAERDDADCEDNDEPDFEVDLIEM